MDRTILSRAIAWLAVLMACTCLDRPAQPSANAQGTMAPAPAGQPAWINQPPMLQVGPTGAVNLDQPMPYTAAQFPAAAYPQQPNMAQPWGTQAVAPQPAWGAPFSPTTNVGGSVPYFFLHRTSIFGEFLYMRPRDAEVAYATTVDPGTLRVAGPVAVIDPEFDPAFRVGVNFAVSDGNSIAARFTRLESETSSAAAVDPATLALLSLVNPLGQVILASDVTASQNIDLDLIDLDFRGLLAGCECGNYAYAVNYFAGAQYAMLDQEFHSSFVVPNILPPDVISTTDTSINFDGVGMRLGMQGERFFPSSGLFVYGTGGTNVLFGEFDASYVQSIDGVVGASASWSAGRVVPVLDLELGAGWLGANRHLRLSAGYRISAWYNVVKTEDWIWAAQNQDFRNLDGTLTFDGLVARAEWLF